MRTTARNVTLVALTVLLIAALVGYLWTREATNTDVGGRTSAKGKPAPTRLVDQTPLETARDLSHIASTSEEQRLSTDAIRLADHEVDLAFASALQVAELHPPIENSTTKDLNDRISRMTARLKQVQQQQTRLSALVADPRNQNNQSLQGQLDLVQSRATLLQDALDDAREDLVHAGGDPQAEIKHELDDHEALDNGHGTTVPASAPKPTALGMDSNLISQFRTWQNVRNNHRRLLQAQLQAATYARTLTHKHDAIAKGMTDALGEEDEASDDGDDNPPSTPERQTQTAEKATKFRTLSDNSKLLTKYDKRIKMEQQLAELYGQWADIVADQIHAALHAILRSLVIIFVALIGIVLAEGFIERFYMRVGPDRRRVGTMRLVLRFISQLVGVVVILLVLFGVPSQLSTVLALGAAGLTVALKDFIVAFFGWFVLMGRHGIRAGDWVEINGIGGEVVEVGLLRTILLETGNWSDAGHPTGRKVSFVNSYAIEGHYFNFTTAGQWLWDELDVLIPTGEDPYYLTNSVLKLVSESTQADSALAEEEWRRVTRRSAFQNFSAAPAIDVRPTNLGVNLVVRYVVNAHNRYDVRTRLYQAIVGLLHGSKTPQAIEKQESATL